MMDKRFTFRVKGWLLEKLSKEKDASKIIRAALQIYYGGSKK